MKAELVKIMKEDCKLLNNLSDTMRAYEWEVISCGRSGQIEMKAVKEKVINVIKVLVNYL